MAKSLLKEKEKELLGEELSELTLMHDYLLKTGRERETFSSIRRMSDIELADGSIKIPNIIVMQNTEGKSEILNITNYSYEQEQIQKLMDETGLNRKDILSLMCDGLRLEQIEVMANNLPYKDIADSAAIREMIRKEINPDQLKEMRKKGVEIKALKDGTVQVKNLQELAEVDERGLTKLDPELEEKLKPFEQVGLIKLSKDLVVKEVESDDKEKENSLKVVSLQEKQAEKTKEEIEKQKVAKDLGVDSDYIVSMIKIEDKDEGSKLLNDKADKNDTKYIIRTRDGAVSSKFITVRETEDGKFEQLQGYEITPVAREVAHVLRDTMGNKNNPVKLKPGEIRAGKGNPNQTKYNYFQIRKRGVDDTKEDNYLLFIGEMGETDLNLIESRNTGNSKFVNVQTSKVYPESIYMEGRADTDRQREVKVTQFKDEVEEKQDVIERKEEQETPYEENQIKFEDISKRKELLERLNTVEDRIIEIESRTGHNEQCVENCIKIDDEETIDSKTEVDMSYELGDEKRELPDLYAQRSTILAQLNIDEARATTREIEDEEYEYGMKRQRPR